MSVLGELSTMKQSTALYLGVFVFAFLAPGFLTAQVFWPHLLIEYDFWKSALLSIALTGPGLFVPFVFALIIKRALLEKSPSHAELYGDFSDWFLRLGVNNAFNYYLLVTLAYVLNWEVLTFLISLFLLAIVLGVLSEFFELYKVIKKSDADQQ